MSYPSEQQSGLYVFVYFLKDLIYLEYLTDDWRQTAITSHSLVKSYLLSIKIFIDLLSCKSQLAFFHFFAGNLVFECWSNIKDEP